MKIKIFSLMIFVLSFLSFSIVTNASNEKMQLYFEDQNGYKQEIASGVNSEISFTFESYLNSYQFAVVNKVTGEKVLGYDDIPQRFINKGKIKLDFNGLYKLSYQVNGSNNIEYKSLSKDNFYILINGENYELVINNKVVSNTFQAILDFQFNPTHKFAITGKDFLITNVDQPLTIEQIKTNINLEAIDPYDGNITNSIKVISDSYSSNKSRVGDYKIVFGVKNSSNIEALYELNISNRDLTPPVIEGPSEKVVGYKDTINNETVLNYFKASDNYDNPVDFKVIESNYVSNKVGVYSYTLEAKDTSNNKTNANFSLKVIDDVKPNFKDLNEGTIKVNFKEEINNYLLLLNLEANDEIDGDLTSSIKVIKNDIKPILGKYSVTYEVSDKSGNKTNYERIYEVISLDAPVFWVSSNLLTIENVNSLNMDQIVKIISVSSEINIVNYEVTNDTYSNNKNISGIYNVSLRATDNNGVVHNLSQDIRVFDNSELVIEKTKNYTKQIVIGLVSITLITGIGISFVLYKNKK